MTFTNKDIIQGNWMQIKGKLRQQWGKLTDDQVTRMRGNFEELVGLLQKTYGYQKEQAQREVETFIRKNNLK